MKWNFILVGFAIMIVIDARRITKQSKGFHHGKKTFKLPTTDKLN